jgi:site-specific DNA-methyltransferase (adenine-specific)
MFWSDKIQITNEDNMQLMARYPDNYFDLAIVDPPYGINMDGGKIGFNGKMKRNGTTNLSLKSKEFVKKSWDIKPPCENYFNELFRISKNQIIWGNNYFGFKGGAIFWDKDNGDSNFSDGEIAYQSFTKSVRKFKYRWHGFFQEKMSVYEREIKIHPTQKPVDLYKWLLDKYAKQGDKILDTHLGSGSIAIACHDYGFELTACELDTEYYEAAKKRFLNHSAQTKLFIV